MAYNYGIILKRFLFFALMIMQTFFFAAFPVTYQDNSVWYATVILFLPSFLGLFWWINAEENLSGEDVYLMLIFWALYIWIGIVPMTAVVFGLIGDRIEFKGFWNPNTLRITLCITPFLWLLVCQTAKTPLSLRFDSPLGITRYTVMGMVHLYDAIELLGDVVSESEYGTYRISADLKYSLIAFACIKNLWLPFVMKIELHGERERRDRFCWLAYYIVELVFETVFLGLRLGLCLGYEITASIFINKNIAMIIVHMHEIYNLYYGNEEVSSAPQSSDTLDQGGAVSGLVYRSSTVAPAPATAPALAPGDAPAPAPGDAPPPYTPWLHDPFMGQFPY